MQELKMPLKYDLDVMDSFQKEILLIDSKDQFLKEM